MTESIAFLSASRQLALMSAGDVSAGDLVRACYAQIEQLDATLRAFITVRPTDDVRQAASDSERRYRRGEARPLEGLLLAVKDVIPTAGLRTTYGSLEFAANVPDEDAASVARLRGAGAIVIGKTSTPEFAAYMNTRNALVGATRNAWAPDRSAGGSSGGTAVAIATGMASLGLGTDLGGSIRIPAAFNGIVGLRPTPGLVPAYPSWWPFDAFTVTGPMCRSVADIELMLTVMSGADARSPLPPVASYRPTDRSIRPRVAWSEDLDGLFAVDPTVRNVLRQARSSLVRSGFAPVDAAPPLHGIRDSILPLRMLRTLVLHAGRLGATSRLDNKLLAAAIERAQQISALDIARAEIARSTVWAAAQPFFREFDILAMPATQMPNFALDEDAPAEIDGVAITDVLDAALATYAITMLGWTSLVVPCGFTAKGEPIGLQLVAPQGREDDLISFGLQLEVRLGWSAACPPIAAVGTSQATH
ncbi:MAG: amidase [Betaproteobacteria bacterium]|nr:amidase [Betaproteobacteria bacterium]